MNDHELSDFCNFRSCRNSHKGGIGKRREYEGERIFIWRMKIIIILFCFFEKSFAGFWRVEEENGPSFVSPSCGECFWLEC